MAETLKQNLKIAIDNLADNVDSGYQESNLVEVCQIIKQRGDLPKEAIQLCKQKLQSKNVKVLLVILELVEMATFYVGFPIWNQIAAKDFLAQMNMLLLLKGANAEASTKTVYLLALWEQIFQKQKDLLSFYYDFFEKVKAKRKNITFSYKNDSKYQKYSTILTQNVANTTNKSTKEQELDIIMENIILTNSIIDEHNPRSDINSNDVLVQLIKTVKNSEGTIQSYLNTTNFQEENLLNLYLLVNDDIIQTNDRIESLRMRNKPKVFISNYFKDEKLAKNPSPVSSPKVRSLKKIEEVKNNQQQQKKKDEDQFIDLLGDDDDQSQSSQQQQQQVQATQQVQQQITQKVEAPQQNLDFGSFTATSTTTNQVPVANQNQTSNPQVNTLNNQMQNLNIGTQQQANTAQQQQPNLNMLYQQQTMPGMPNQMMNQQMFNMNQQFQMNPMNMMNAQQMMMQQNLFAQQQQNLMFQQQQQQQQQASMPTNIVFNSASTQQTNTNSNNSQQNQFQYNTKKDDKKNDNKKEAFGEIDDFFAVKEEKKDNTQQQQQQPPQAQAKNTQDDFDDLFA